MFALTYNTSRHSFQFTHGWHQFEEQVLGGTMLHSKYSKYIPSVSLI